MAGWIMDNIFIAGGIGCALWMLSYAIGVRTMLNSTRIRDIEAPEDGGWPAVSVVFAARDEEAEIGSALKALVSLDYPSLEIIAVDDRSADSTGSIIDEMAGYDGRIKPVHIETLPEGWLGKVNALNEGLRMSTGQWVLFTDGDVKLAPDTIKRAVTLGRQRDAEHVVLFPKLLGASYLLEVAFVAFALMFTTGTRAHKVGKPGSEAYIGVGAFNMVRREALLRSAGFEWIRMEVCDDVGLGLLMRDAGAKTVFAFAGMWVHLVWYATLPQMFGGMEKNLFSTMHYSFPRLIGSMPFLFAIGLSPFMAILPSAPLYLKVMALVTVTLSGVMGLLSRGLFIRRSSVFLLAPVGLMLVTFMILNSSIKCALRGGIEWRGTLYPLKELRKGQRVKL